MKYSPENTIAAISTPQGSGGIGIIRVSGSKAIKIGDKIFAAKDKKPVSESPTHTVHYGKIISNNTHIDNVMLTVLKEPRTYTGEDTIEISCHGGLLITKKILEIVLNAGAELAGPGEFTKRAYLSGKFDLAQAEAVADLISSKTEKAQKVALSQLEGVLSKRINDIKQKIVSVLAEMEVSLDHSEEDIKFLNKKEIVKKIGLIKSELNVLISSYKTGKIIRDGIRVCIIGKPNVGKSSLLNAILKEERAIVTEIPGTTRDTIEERIEIKGIPITITDTAGIRNGGEKIEMLGVERSKKTIEMADLILFVIDTSVPLSKEDEEIDRELKDKKVVVVLNKSDLKSCVNKSNLASCILSIASYFIKTSALTGFGIKEIEEKILELFSIGEIDISDEPIITNIRHTDLVKKALLSLTEAEETTKKGDGEEFISLGLTDALNNLGGIIGEVVSEDVLDEIFSRFCIGK